MNPAPATRNVPNRIVEDPPLFVNGGLNPAWLERLDPEQRAQIVRALAGSPKARPPLVPDAAASEIPSPHEHQP